MLSNTKRTAGRPTAEKRSDVTKQRILMAAEEEFAEKGLYGTRVDEIAIRAGVNKRMMYVYFGNKEELYALILKQVYDRLCQYEGAIEDVTSVEILVLKYFDFLRINPNFVKLTLWENLNESKYFKLSGAFEALKSMTDKLAMVLESKKSDVAGENVDCVRLAATINAMCISVYSDMYNMSSILGRDLTTDEEIKKQAEYICRIITSYIK